MKPNEGQQGDPVPECHQCGPARQSPTKSSKVNQSCNIIHCLLGYSYTFSMLHVSSRVSVPANITCPFIRQLLEKYHMFSAKHALKCLLQQNTFPQGSFQEKKSHDTTRSPRKPEMSTSIGFYTIFSFVDTITNPIFYLCLYSIPTHTEYSPIT